MCLYLLRTWSFWNRGFRKSLQHPYYIDALATFLPTMQWEAPRIMSSKDLPNLNSMFSNLFHLKEGLREVGIRITLFVSPGKSWIAKILRKIRYILKCVSVSSYSVSTDMSFKCVTCNFDQKNKFKKFFMQWQCGFLEKKCFKLLH